MEVYQRTLLLDQNFQPLKVISWQKAMLLLFLEKAEIVGAYDNIQIHSGRQSFTLPSILRLMKKNKRSAQKVAFSKSAIFLRDNYECAYCGTKKSRSDLTIDHVVPVCQGGPKNFKNIVTACHPCNEKKAGRTPDQAHMPLRFEPHEPSWNPSFYIQVKKQDPLHQWKMFLPTFKTEF